MKTHKIIMAALSVALLVILVIVYISDRKPDYVVTQDQFESFIQQEMDDLLDGSPSKEGTILFMDCRGTLYFEESKYFDNEYSSGVKFDFSKLDAQDLNNYIKYNFNSYGAFTSKFTLAGDPLWTIYYRGNEFNLVVTSNESGKVVSIDLGHVYVPKGNAGNLAPGDYDNNNDGTIDNDEINEYKEDQLDMYGYYSDELRDNIDGDN